VNGNYEYQYSIFQGVNPTNQFTHFHRKYFNIKVINALRDVESEMKNSKKSPITHLIKQYEFERLELESIAQNLKSQSDEVLSLDELKDLMSNVNSRFSKIIGIHPDSQIHLATNDIDPNRILTTLKLMMGENKRPTSDTSLGLTNILYISLILLTLEDRTIPSYLKAIRYHSLVAEVGGGILAECYEINENQNYLLKQDLEDLVQNTLYGFMDQHNQKPKGFTILALEEPEAHLHPTLQRVIYKDVMNGDASILMTTHSPHITSLAPLDSIVHLRWTNDGTLVKSTAELEISTSEKRDLERYLDVRRGEIYFGKGVILVEGIAEEYILPKFAELLDKPLDLKGILVCNINSTNFKPYVKFLEQLGIPYVGITDGDYYNKDTPDSDRKYHVLHDSGNKFYGYLGNENVGKLLRELGKVSDTQINVNFAEQDELFSAHGFYIGGYTLEVDIMKNCSTDESKLIISNIFNDLTLGGVTQKSNFKSELENGLYFNCLRKIEASKIGIGKGRFAQSFSTLCIKDHIPNYIEEAVNKIYTKVDE
jgi:putative ATP-dependent endonuclease of OLD family